VTDIEPTPLDFHGATPLYRQIAEYLYDRILDGTLAPGISIGSEVDLQAKFGVSRVTLRQAIGILVDQGLVVRKQGKGTYVQESPLDFPLDTLEGTTQRASTLGVAAASRVTELDIIRATASIRATLELPKGANVLRVGRVDYAGSRPLAFATIHVPEAIGSRLSVDELAGEALYPLLEKSHGLVATQAFQTIEAAAASERTAALLELPVGAPVLVVKRTTRDQENVPFEHSVIEFNARAMQFSVSLRRRLGEVLPYRIEEHVLVDGSA
jgi:GntR family transcriptional regulator